MIIKMKKMMIKYENDDKLENEDDEKKENYYHDS